MIVHGIMTKWLHYKKKKRKSLLGELFDFYSSKP